MEGSNNEIGEDFLYTIRVGNVEDLKFFIRANPSFSINYKNEHGNTCAHYAAANNKHDVLKFLLENGADYNIKNQSGNTPLQWAVQTNSINSIKILLSEKEGGHTRKFDFVSTNAFGKSVIGDAFEKGNDEVLQLILSHPCAEKLDETCSYDSPQSPLNIIQEFDLNIIVNGIQITIRELALSATNDLDHPVIPDSSEPDFTGIVVWESSICLSNWIADMASQFNDKSVLELGSGCGLPGITAAIFNISMVILTDYFATALDNLRQNIQLNISNIKSKVDVLKLNWDDFTDFNPAQVDIIIASDIIYDKDAPLKIVNVLNRLLRKGGKLYYTYTSPRAGTDEFIKLLNGFEVELGQVPHKYRICNIPNLSKDCLQLKFPLIYTDSPNNQETLMMLCATKL